MIALQAELVQEEVEEVLKQICAVLKIEATINSEFKPGDIIKSQVLLTAIGSIEEALGVKIPNDCYIFCDKNQNQLTIQETVNKIIKVAKYEH